MTSPPLSPVAKSAHRPVRMFTLKLPDRLSARVGLRAAYSAPSRRPSGNQCCKSDGSTASAARLTSSKSIQPRPCLPRPLAPVAIGCRAVLGRYGGTNGNFVLVDRRSCEADGPYEAVERGADGLIEAIEEGKPLARQGGVAGDRVEEAGREGSAEPVEEFQEDQTDGISLGRQSVATRAGQFLDEALGAELREVVAQRAKAVWLGGGAQGSGHMRMDL